VSDRTQTVEFSRKELCAIEDALEADIAMRLGDPELATIVPDQKRALYKVRVALEAQNG
jgi:hypothetical protein